ncbi:unnamed protein product [Cylicostephanus goldi]|uniref:Uncharacterized protein n=1 Tax=Cylicostephanus goldi TaxID=71465 RepID=A0A3P6RJX4_CYLGO|nr:unnamed protein product [Cylicostephanus goldi]
MPESSDVDKMPESSDMDKKPESSDMDKLIEIILIFSLPMLLLIRNIKVKRWITSAISGLVSQSSVLLSSVSQHHPTLLTRTTCYDPCYVVLLHEKVTTVDITISY